MSNPTTTPDDATEILLIEAEKSLLEVIKNLLVTNKDKIGTFSVKLTPDMIKYINILLENNPSFFKETESSLNTIISDNTINIKDIPEILVLVNKLYSLIYNTKAIGKGTDYYEIVKTLFHVILVVYIQTHNIQNDKLTEPILKLIDACIDLIKLQKHLKPIKCKLF